MPDGSAKRHKVQICRDLCYLPSLVSKNGSNIYGVDGLVRPTAVDEVTVLRAFEVGEHAQVSAELAADERENAAVIIQLRSHQLSRLLLPANVQPQAQPYSPYPRL